MADTTIKTIHGAVPPAASGSGDRRAYPEGRNDKNDGHEEEPGSSDQVSYTEDTAFFSLSSIRLMLVDSDLHEVRKSALLEKLIEMEKKNIHEIAVRDGEAIIDALQSYSMG